MPCNSCKKYPSQLQSYYLIKSLVFWLHKIIGLNRTMNACCQRGSSTVPQLFYKCIRWQQQVRSTFCFSIADVLNVIDLNVFSDILELLTVCCSLDCNLTFIIKAHKNVAKLVSNASDSVTFWSGLSVPEFCMREPLNILLLPYDHHSLKPLYCFKDWLFKWWE